MTFAFTFLGGKRLVKTIAATAGNVAANLSPGVGKRWIVLHGSVILDNDATVANRYVVTQLTDGTDVIAEYIGSAAITQDQTRTVNFPPSVEHSGGGVLGTVVTLIKLGLVVLEGADQLRITISGGVAGDSFSGSFVVLEIDI